jgi:hypothetical protein
MAADWEILEVLGTEEEAQLICGYLEGQGIPCQVESAHSHEFPVNVTALGNVRVEVPTERVEEARRLLADRERTPMLGDDVEGSEAP